MIQFHDDVLGAAKIFARLNSYRKLNGFREVRWNEILCELAVSRSHQLIRTKIGTVNLLQVGRARFNLGVPYCDVAVINLIEENDGKQLPVHRMMGNTWSKFPKISEVILEPLVRFAAISVYMSDEKACITIFFSMMLPGSFPPKRLWDREERKRRNKKRKPRKEMKLLEESDKVIATSGVDSDSLGRPAPFVVGDMAAMESKIQEELMSSEMIEAGLIATVDVEEQVRHTEETSWLDGPARIQDCAGQEDIPMYD